MNAIFIIKAAEVRLASAEKFEKIGNTRQAIEDYKIALDNFKKASFLDPQKANEWLSKVDYCQEKIDELSSPNYVNKAQNNRSNDRDRGANRSEKSSSVNNNKESSKERIQNGGEEDFSDYNLNISMPTNKLKFDDVIGLHEAKASINRMLIAPLASPEVYKKYGLKVGGFLLLYGPPGTGKTSFAKAVASELNFPFVAESCTSLVNSLIGETGKNIEKLFKEVRRFVSEQDKPIILYLDEFDSIAKASGGSDKTADEAVPTLKIQLDGFDSNNDKIFIIAATNLIDNIDEGIKSRFKMIEIPLPDTDSREKIFRMRCKKVDLNREDIDQIDFRELALASEDMSGRDINLVMTEFFSALAERDRGVEQINVPLTEFMIGLIKKIKSKGSKYN